ncbi:MAG: bifunctional hydroxymethylpyrimidine kinase/phosphomethylpyrimidine kinase, partial [Fervidicoccaceae archaeon]
MVCSARTRRAERSPPRALTIAGSDSGGGAGIQADLKTFAALGVHGMSAITSITAQNTLEVRGIYDVSPEMVALQIDAVAQDIGVDAAKTGMLSNSAIVSVVAKKVSEYGFPLVVDPVMIAKSGARLLREDAVEALTRELLPLATVVTPNRMEAEALSGIEIRSLDDAVRAAKKIIEELRPRIVVIKGGHLAGEESIDVVHDGASARILRAPRIPEEEACTHGTGCSFSAAIAAYIALGLDPIEAIAKAKEFITGAIKYSYRVGGGHCPVNPMYFVVMDAEKHRIARSLTEAVRRLNEKLDVVVGHVPESKIRIAACLPPWYVRGIDEVASIPGGLALVGSELRAASPPVFGASGDRAASLLLEATRAGWPHRAALAVAFSRELVEAAEKRGLIVYVHDWR